MADEGGYSGERCEGLNDINGYLHPWLISILVPITPFWTGQAYPDRSKFLD